MRECTGEETMKEFLYHLGLKDTINEMLPHIKVSLAGMPYITSKFMPRTRRDRPKVIPQGCVNLAFIGQFVEVEDDAVFTVETSVRTAMMAAYGLLKLDKPIIPVYPTKYDLRILAAMGKSMANIKTVTMRNLLRTVAPLIIHPGTVFDGINRIPVMSKV